MEKKSLPRRIYRKAPIIEALIDIRFDTLIEYSKLETVAREKFLSNYPQMEPQTQAEFRFTLDENPVKPLISPNGLRFTSSDRKQILQLRIDGFLFSRLAPYNRWETFRDEAKQLFQLYREIARPKNIIRSAVRFINRFDLPGPPVELSEYLNIFPQVPKDYEMKGLAMQVTIAQDELKSTLVISQALVPPNKPGIVSLLLDFDLFSEEVRPCTEDIWSFFEQLHAKKNEVFERAITEKTREMIS